MPALLAKEAIALKRDMPRFLYHPANALKSALPAPDIWNSSRTNMLTSSPYAGMVLYSSLVTAPIIYPKILPCETATKVRASSLSIRLLKYRLPDSESGQSGFTVGSKLPDSRTHKSMQRSAMSSRSFIVAGRTLNFISRIFAGLTINHMKGKVMRMATHHEREQRKRIKEQSLDEERKKRGAKKKVKMMLVISTALAAVAVIAYLLSRAMAP